MGGYISAMGKYASFSGRSGRQEYWLFLLVLMLLSLAASVLDLLLFGTALEHQGPIGALVLLVHFVPAVSVSVRRLHDVGRTGCWLVLGLTVIGMLAIFSFALRRGDAGPNRYGAEPEELSPYAIPA